MSMSISISISIVQYSIVLVLAFAKQLCVLVEALAIPHTLNSASVDVVTVSIGVYSETTINAQSGERLLQCADTALYQAKTSGRNQAVQYLS